MLFKEISTSTFQPTLKYVYSAAKNDSLPKISVWNEMLIFPSLNNP